LKFDHIAIVVANISKSIEWYSERFSEFKLLYSDDTWAIANIGELRLAFVLKTEHPRHIAFTPEEDLVHPDFVDKPTKLHRDGTSSFYINDPDGNTIEILFGAKNG